MLSILAFKTRRSWQKLRGNPMEVQWQMAASLKEEQKSGWSVSKADGQFAGAAIARGDAVKPEKMLVQIATKNIFFIHESFKLIKANYRSSENDFEISRRIKQ